MIALTVSMPIIAAALLDKESVSIFATDSNSHNAPAASYSLSLDHPAAILEWMRTRITDGDRLAELGVLSCWRAFRSSYGLSSLAFATAESARTAVEGCGDLASDFVGGHAQRLINVNITLRHPT